MKLTAIIRRARPDDIPHITPILTTTNLGAEELDLHIENFFVAVDGEQIIGTIGLELYGSRALLRSAALLPTHQHHGIGTNLLAAAEEFAKIHQVSEIFLLTTTASDYFKRHGYTTVRREEIRGSILGSAQFRYACPATATAMQKKL